MLSHSNTISTKTHRPIIYTLLQLAVQCSVLCLLNNKYSILLNVLSNTDQKQVGVGSNTKGLKERNKEGNCNRHDPLVLINPASISTTYVLILNLYKYVGESNENLKYFLSHNLLNTKGTQ
jgi:hypothetical protein